MKNHAIKTLITAFLVALDLCMASRAEASAPKPWDHGDLKVSQTGDYLQHEDGTPFFWLGDTGWLLPQRLDRDEVELYLSDSRDKEFNVVQVQVLNDVPSINAYGALSHTDGWNMESASRPGEYGYWEHLDHIIDTAGRQGIYIGMVCIWGGVVKSGKMSEEEAVAYGDFLASRYGKKENIIWIIGGDIQGDVKKAEWEALARSIKAKDSKHLMTFHPRGRTVSARWFANADWIDFHLFQSGHRRYGQRMDNKNYPIPDGTEEDNWMYVDSIKHYQPLKPAIDGEPSYEDIPQGLHSSEEPKWTAKDARRYAYWGVFGGACGHTYGHNAIMQFVRPGVAGAYFADGDKMPWYKALNAPGRTQMQHLKRLMEKFPTEGRHTAQEAIKDNGLRYDRLIATAGADYMLVYNHTGRPMKLDLSGISGKEKEIWTMNPVSGSFQRIGSTATKDYSFTPTEADEDIVLIVYDGTQNYLEEGEKRSLRGIEEE